MKEEFIVCRCEEVTVEQLEDAYVSGAITSRQLKMKTRATMGACQGRVCRQLVNLWLSKKDPCADKGVEPLSYRAPIRLVTFGELAGGE
ncbi:BFD-like [2Fe-2S] binding domain-containing protein [Thermoactinomyces sp. DSM 45891]|uniref:(2Fe-2S)-binding protein n=1 Tax=Thermoactinomyces sp. DSM 45891 TaxID=1761907 RepID=UPI00091F9001|nr:(2Fe-2S)-binding protein [Thermoactinomyces sp. DSM 45891]SFX03651.1 BFD-like [2Fe-2S] binding domain-containing protein [Thermoactinomyces sp. DSM 45891]